MVGQANGAQGGRMMQRLTQPRVFSFISRVETKGARLAEEGRGDPDRRKQGVNGGGDDSQGK